MYIQKIKLQNFRNYDFEEIELYKGTNIFFGDNAQGKTNILEAIFISSLGKSFRTNKEKELIKENKENAKIEIEFVKEKRTEKIKLDIADKKVFSVNEIILKKTSEIVGKINIVLFTPEDINILKNEPIKRRRFLNIMISQLRPLYIHLLSQYNKILEQRNNYLKQIKYENKNRSNLEIWDEQLINIGMKIFNYRKEFIEKINEKIKKIHLDTTENKEKIEIKYKSNVISEEEYRRKIKIKQEDDIQKGYTSIGIHRDDFEIYINKKDVSVFGSQGQQRSSIISLKLAEAEVIYDEKEDYPILLLDDFMSELDKKRVKGFIKRIKDNQVLITCTDKFDIDNMVYNVYKVEKANVERMK
jgi:DNA replication and repair protein RecF